MFDALAERGVHDLYLPAEEPEAGWIYTEEGGPYPVPSELHEVVANLYQQAQAAERAEFLIKQDAWRLRGTRLDTVDGTVYAIRVNGDQVWTLGDCGFSPPYREYLMDERLCKGGLVVVAGEAGNGKTTTCSALLVDRLDAFGGVGIAIEDPPEFPIHGTTPSGRGVAFQMKVEDTASFPQLVRRSLRGYPSSQRNLLMIGEVRDGETAMLALRAAVDGRLVVLSLHAKDTISALERVVSLAQETGAPAMEVRSLLGAGFRAVLFQDLVNGRVRPRLLQDTNSTAGLLSDVQTPLKVLATEMENQKILMSQKKPVEVRR